MRDENVKAVKLDKSQYKEVDGQKTARSKKSINATLADIEKELDKQGVRKANETPVTPKHNLDMFAETPTTWQKRVVVITGGSAGIGFATAHRFSLYADSVYNLDIKKGDDENINFIKTDITNPDEVRDSIRKIFNAEGQIDILINNAGVGISGAVEELKMNDILRVFNTNFFGAVLACQSVLPYMRDNHRGTIINIGCVPALGTAPFTAIYSASKSALEKFSLSLRREVAPIKIKVLTVLLPNVKTDFTENRIKQESNKKQYKYRISKIIGKVEFAEQNGISPDLVAEKIYKLSNKKIITNPIIVLGFWNRVKVFFLRFVPRKWW
jgi:short-subunit dehydrogenase